MGIVTGNGWRRLSVGVGEAMSSISYSRHQFPPVVIQHAVWLYLSFTFSYRDLEELLLSGAWTSPARPLTMGSEVWDDFCTTARARRQRPNSQWHLDEMVALIGGKRFRSGETKPQR